MNRHLLSAATIVILVLAAPLARGQTSSNATGGAGGAGGSAVGGTATGGTATNSNTTSGVSTASGGTGGTARGGAGGTSTASGGSVGSVSTGGSAATLGDITVNWNTGTQPMGKDGLGVGVDPSSGHIVTDNLVKYGGSYKVKSTPDVGVGGPASGPCNGFSAGIGVSVAGFGIGGNTSTVDDGCSARETARIAAMLGRMDIANALLENLPQVQAALRAKVSREALDRSPEALKPVSTPNLERGADNAKVEATKEALLRAIAEFEQAKRAAALQLQQDQAEAALTRQATMAKLNDTLKFTDITTQANEKTPQEQMAEELALGQTPRKARIELSEAESPPARTPAKAEASPPFELADPRDPLIREPSTPSARRWMPWR